MSPSTGLLIMNELAGSAPVHLEFTQQLLAPYAQQITYCWIALWCATGLYLLWLAFFRKSR